MYPYEDHVSHTRRTKRRSFHREAGRVPTVRIHRRARRREVASHARARPLASERTSDDSLLFFLLPATRWRAIRAVTDARAPRAGARARTRRRVMRADTRRAGARGVDARAIRARVNRSRWVRRIFVRRCRSSRALGARASRANAEEDAAEGKDGCPRARALFDL